MLNVATSKLSDLRNLLLFVLSPVSWLSVVSSKKPETTVTLTCRPTAEEQNRRNREIELNLKNFLTFLDK